MPKDKDASLSHKRTSSASAEEGGSSAEQQSEWQKVKDPSSGDFYWWNTLTDKTTWHDPFNPDSCSDSEEEEGEEEEHEEEDQVKRDEPSTSKAASASSSHPKRTIKYQDPASAPYYPPESYFYAHRTQDHQYTSSYGQFGAHQGDFESASKLDALLDQIDQGQGFSNSTFDREAGVSATAVLPAHLQHYQKKTDDSHLTEHERIMKTAAAPITMPDSYQDYTSSAHFNRKSGRFEGRPAERAPETMAPEKRAAAVMSDYFDYNQWLEQRNAELRQQGAQRQKAPSKKELNVFKKRKEERKRHKNRWLYED